ncbi:hypothetical protein KFU94_40805 [Chloroflexi bacterium TSY]|nr:hypothetical protein [Chloroflexi bacterium TSY]
MVFRLGRINGVEVTEMLALAIWELTQGYPYPVECMMNSVCPAVERLPDIDSLNEIVLFELTHRRGSLREHYEEEYGKYVRELNGDQLTRKILFWIANHPKERILAEKVATALDADLLEIQDSLEKLYRADVIRRASISSFWGPAEPLMREFLKYEHYLDVEDLPREDATAELRRKVRSTLGELNRRTGHFTEIVV